MPSKYEKERAVKIAAGKTAASYTADRNPDRVKVPAFNPQTHERVWDDARRCWIEKRKV